MRIRRLDLIRIGPFTGQSLHFDRGTFGLHLVYGPNEAGKSSSLRALTQWLFGIETESKSADAFKHNHRDIRVGGVIEDHLGNSLACIRRSGKKSSLRADNDKTSIPLEQLDRFLGSMTIEEFKRDFGIDLEQLIAGGRELASGTGDAGKALFAASFGGINLSTVMRNLDAECEALFKPGGKVPLVNAALAEFETARRDVRDKSISSKLWQEKSDALRQLIAKRSTIEDEIVRLQTRRQRLSRIRESLPLIGKLKDYAAEIAPLAKVPRLRAEFNQQRTAAESAIAIANGTIKLAIGEMTTVREKIDALEVPQSILDHETAIDELYKRVAQYRSWVQACLELRSERKALQQKIDRTMKELRASDDARNDESSDPDRWRISTVERSRIHELAQQRSGCVTTLDDSSDEFNQKAKFLAKANAAIEAAPPQRDLRPLRQAIDEALKQGDLEHILKEKESRCRDLVDQAERDFAKLGLATGSFDRIESLLVPSAETISRFDVDITEVDKSIEKIEEERHRLEDELAIAESRLRAIELNQDVPTEDELVAARSKRDSSWREYRNSGASDRDSADEIERLIEMVDDIGDRLRREADRVAEKSNLIVVIEQKRQSLARRSERLTKSQSERQNLQRDWENAWKAAEVEPLSPREMNHWLSRHANLVHLAESIRDQNRDCDNHRVTIDLHRQSLRSALVAVSQCVPDDSIADDDESLVSLVDSCRSACEQWESEAIEFRQRNENGERARSEMEVAETKLDRAKEAMQRWTQDWQSAVCVLDQNAQLTANQATEMLRTIDEVVKDIDEVQKLNRQFQDHHDQIESFDADVASLTRRLDIETPNRSVEQIVADLHDRLMIASQNKTVRDGLSEQTERLESQVATADRTLVQQTALLDGLCREAGVSKTEMLPDIEAKAAHLAKLESQIAENEEQLRVFAGGVELDAFVRDALTEDADGLEPQIGQINEEVSRLESELKTHSETIGVQQKELKEIDGSSKSAIANQTAEESLARVRRHGEQYVRVKLASAILKRAVERYRSQNQGPLLQRASELFAELTLGNFSGLQPDFGDSDESLLVGVRASDSALVGVNGMSEGTCDQLFLSLRLAALESRFAHRPPVPFVVDDILAKFDDQRSAAAFRVLAELSKTTQVIMFTHHRHLIDVASGAVPPDVLFVQSLDGSIEASAPVLSETSKATKQDSVKRRADKTATAENTGSLF